VVARQTCRRRDHALLRSRNMLRLRPNSPARTLHALVSLATEPAAPHPLSLPPLSTAQAPRLASTYFSPSCPTLSLFCPSHRRRHRDLHVFSSRLSAHPPSPCPPLPVCPTTSKRMSHPSLSPLPTPPQATRRERRKLVSFCPPAPSPPSPPRPALRHAVWLRRWRAWNDPPSPPQKKIVTLPVPPTSAVNLLSPDIRPHVRNKPFSPSFRAAAGTETCGGVEAMASLE
jgi:hypothetical protein